MSEKLTLHDAIRYNSIQNLQHELDQKADSDEARRLAGELEAILSKARGPKTRQQALELALQAVRQSGEANRRLAVLTRRAAKSGSMPIEVFEPTPGEMQPVQPGPLLVCPVPDCTYQQYLLAKGEVYTCPVHGLELRQKSRRSRRK